MMENFSKILIFSDLDGTLLDDKTYSFEKAKDALNLIKKLKIPLILTSSKTKKEIEYYRNKLKNKDPFISENGGGIFIPKNYFKKESYFIEEEKYFIIRLGESYENLRKALKEAKKDGFNLNGFGDMTLNEIMVLTNLKKKEAIFCKDRYFDEVFLFYGLKKEEKEMIKYFKEKGLKITKGKYFHLMGKNDKGKAVKVLLKLYKKKYGKVFSIGLGDSLNDLEMLKSVDLPVLIKKENGSYENINLKKMIKSSFSGSKGFNEVLLKILR